jgi:hypothetical protein
MNGLTYGALSRKSKVTGRELKFRIAGMGNDKIDVYGKKSNNFIVKEINLLNKV